MAGAFDDLIPKNTDYSGNRQNSPETAVSGGAFGDLIPEKPKKTAGGLIDGVSALASGFNRAYLSRAGLPFNPVDVAANVLDLGKAAIGAPITAITGKTPDMLQLRPRGEMVGSGAWIVNQARKSALGRAALDPANPDYEGGTLQALGSGAGGALGAGLSGKQEALNAAMGATSAGASKITHDLTGNTSLAIAAGMLPQAGVMAANNAAKFAIRGDESGRRAMEQRRQDLKEAGIESPSLGLASGNRMLQGTENLLASTPGAANIMDRSRQGLLAGITGKVDEAASLAAPTRGVREAGTAIQSGLQGFKKYWKDKQEILWDQKLGAVIPPDQPTSIVNTRATLGLLNQDIPRAPALSRFFKNGKLQSMEEALASDTQAAPMLLRNVPKDDLPFEAVKKLRTLVGGEIADNNLLSDIPRSKWNPLYGALSDDIRATAANVGPQATNAFNRANNYTRTGMGRLDRVAPFADAPTPERAFNSLMSAAKENTSTLQAVKKSLPSDARGTIAGTVIERLGKAAPGQQDDGGGVWSPNTFLTNWNKLSPQSRTEMFSGFKNAPEVAAQVEAVAKAASMLRDSSKIWANPSGTAPALSARATYGGLGIGMLTGQAPLVGAAAAGMLGSNLAARGLTSRRVLDYASNAAAPQDYLNALNPSIPQQIVNLPGLLDENRYK